MCTIAATFQSCTHLRPTTHYHAAWQLSRCLTIIMFSAIVMLLWLCNAFFAVMFRCHCRITLPLSCCIATSSPRLLSYCFPSYAAIQSRWFAIVMLVWHNHASGHYHALLLLMLLTHCHAALPLMRQAILMLFYHYCSRPDCLSIITCTQVLVMLSQPIQSLRLINSALQQSSYLQLSIALRSDQKLQIFQ